MQPKKERKKPSKTPKKDRFDYTYITLEKPIDLTKGKVNLLVNTRNGLMSAYDEGKHIKTTTTDFTKCYKGDECQPVPPSVKVKQKGIKVIRHFSTNKISKINNGITLSDNFSFICSAETNESKSNVNKYVTGVTYNIRKKNVFLCHSACIFTFIEPEYSPEIVGWILAIHTLKDALATKGRFVGIIVDHANNTLGDINSGTRELIEDEPAT